MEENVVCYFVNCHQMEHPGSMTKFWILFCGCQFDTIPVFLTPSIHCPLQWSPCKTPLNDKILGCSKLIACLIRRRFSFNCILKKIYNSWLFGLFFWLGRHGLIFLLFCLCCRCAHVNSRVPISVSGSGQFEMRRQSSELFLDGTLSPPCQRMGAMVAFQCFDDFKRSHSRQWHSSCCFLGCLRHWWASFAEILMRSSAALSSHCRRVLWSLTCVLASMMRKTSRSACTSVCVFNETSAPSSSFLKRHVSVPSTEQKGQPHPHH